MLSSLQEKMRLLGFGVRISDEDKSLVVSFTIRDMSEADDYLKMIKTVMAECGVSSLFYRSKLGARLLNDKIEVELYIPLKPLTA